jgi:hypothetical protein
MGTVGSTPTLLGLTFIGALLFWLIYSAFAAVQVVSAGDLMLIHALAPVGLLQDLRYVLSGIRIFSPSTTLLIGGGLLVLRAALTGLLISIIRTVQAPEAGTTDAGRSQWRLGGRPGLGSLPILTVIEVVFILLAYPLGIVAGQLFQALGVLVVVAAEMYFLTYAPIVAVVEGSGLRDTFQLALRASRLTSRQHLLLCFMYVSLTVVLFVLSSGTLFPHATPSVPVWTYALFMNFLHVCVLAAFTFRWLAIRDEVWTSLGEASSNGRGRQGAEPTEDDADGEDD